MQKTIGERIKAAREAKGMSQEDLGKSFGATKQTIYKYETGIITNIPLRSHPRNSCPGNPPG